MFGYISTTKPRSTAKPDRPHHYLHEVVEIDQRLSCIQHHRRFTVRPQSCDFSLSLRATKRPNNLCKFNSEKLASLDVRNAFALHLSNCFTSLLDETDLANNSALDQIQIRADILDKALIDTSTAILGKRQRRRQPNWVSASSLKLIDSLKDAKKKYKQLPTPTSKQQWLNLQNQVNLSLHSDEE